MKNQYRSYDRLEKAFEILCDLEKDMWLLEATQSEEHHLETAIAHLLLMMPTLPTKADEQVADDLIAALLKAS